MTSLLELLRRNASYRYTWMGQVVRRDWRLLQ